MQFLALCNKTDCAAAAQHLSHQRADCLQLIMGGGNGFDISVWPVMSAAARRQSFLWVTTAFRMRSRFLEIYSTEPETSPD